MRVLLLTLILVFTFSEESYARLQTLHRHGRQAGGRQCRYRGIYYSIGQQLTFRAQKKIFDCTCRQGGRLDCSWTKAAPPVGAKCVDKLTGTQKRVGERWERRQNGKTFDCLCKRSANAMETYCSDENRCHHDGVSHLAGTSFKTNTISGRPMSCSCMTGKKLSCSHEVEVEETVTDAPWVKNFRVFGGERRRPLLTTLQACRTGAKVVSDGDVWNNTRVNAFGQRVLEQCACVNALVKCRTLRLLDVREPHCISTDGRYRTVGQKWLRVREESPDDQYECTCMAHENSRCRLATRPRCIDDVSGTIRVAGEKWIREHETLANLRFECVCHENRKIACQDIGECDEPSAPDNGAMMCAKIGRPTRDRVTYCKPMCLPGYEFVNQNRYFRLWEVCGAMNLHRWSGGYVDDPSAIARCRRGELGRRRGHPNLYLPTNDCESLNAQQRVELRQLFMRQLEYRSVCGAGCEVTLFKCGKRF